MTSACKALELVSAYGAKTWANHSQEGLLPQSESRASLCTVVQSIAPQFTASSRAPYGREKLLNIGQPLLASSRAWQNTGWPERTKFPTPASSRSLDRKSTRLNSSH